MSDRRLFLSYRREDSAGHAGRLADHLLDRFGAGSVFMDVESIEAGADFTEAIERAISESDAVLVVIGPGWLDATGADGGRRLEEPSDFVRREVEAALASDVRVIPVLVGAATMPPEDRLPGPIAELARRNAVELQDRRWREDVEALVDVLEGRSRAEPALWTGNLPSQPTPFLGRERELGDVCELVQREDVRLLTLTGPGGIGKTRLAVQAASKLANSYPGGAWFVGLAPLTDPELVLAELAAVLDVQESGEGSLLDAIAQRLSRARTLVVLDNLEQLLPDAATPIAELSAAAPSLDIVASSRELLHLSAEREYPVETLSEDEAITLFLERARTVRPDLAPGEGERAAIARICDRLDRLPLAIELAAARTKLLPPVKLLERLDQRLPLMTGGARDVPERHRTLRATIAWSHDLLDEGERDLFERLAVFSGGSTLEAAEAVCGADIDAMQSLVERSLLRQSEGPGGEPRYLMLETIREFALERLEERPEAEDLRRRHAEHLVAMVEAAERELKGPDQLIWLDRLDAEHDNVRSALRWTLDGGDPELGLRLVAGGFIVWYLRRPISEGRRWLVEALERTPAAATEARARALECAGMAALDLGEDATSLFDESRRCAAEVGALATQALATAHLSEALSPDRGGERIPLATEGVRLARESGDDWVLSIALNSLGEVCRRAGDVRAATDAYEESLDLRRAIGDESLVALALVNLAEMAILASDLARARTLSAEALAYAEALDDRRHAAFANAALGWAALAGRDADEARERFGVALAVSRDQGSAPASLVIVLGMAGTAAAANDVVRAARLEAVAVRFADVIGEQPTAADAGIHTRYLNELKASSDPSVWGAAAREGHAMDLDEAITYALSP